MTIKTAQFKIYGDRTCCRYDIALFLTNLKLFQPTNNKARHEELKERAKLLLEKARKDVDIKDNKPNNSSQDKPSANQVCLLYH